MPYHAQVIIVPSLLFITPVVPNPQTPDQLVPWPRNCKMYTDDNTTRFLGLGKKRSACES